MTFCRKLVCFWGIVLAVAIDEIASPLERVLPSWGAPHQTDRTEPPPNVTGIVPAWGEVGQATEVLIIGVNMGEEFGFGGSVL